MKSTSKTPKNKGVFNCQDYREALRLRAEQWKQAEPAATFQALAKACRVQKAYLSRVLQSEADLSQDQLFLACEYLGISGVEREFLFALHAYCRSDVAARRKTLAVELSRLRKLGDETVGNISASALLSDDLERLTPFFLDPDAQLVQLFLSIEQYRQDPRSLVAQLHLTPDRFEQILALLRRLGLIKVNQGSLEVSTPSMHLPSDSAIFRPYRMLLRQRVLHEQATRGDRAGYALSLLFSATKEIEEGFRRRFLDLLKEMEPRVRSAPNEEVFFLGIDLMPWR